MTWRAMAMIALIAGVGSPFAIARTAGASYSDSYTGPGFCRAYGGGVGPQVVIGEVKTNIYECGGDTSDLSATASPYSDESTPFDDNGSGYDPGGSFQCVELSLRFEYVVYKKNTLWIGGKGSLLDPPTGANVVHYLHTVFNVPVAFGNGAIAVPPTSAPAPVAGNILSLGPTSSSEPSGHTAVIERVTGNQKNFTVTIVSENAPTIDTIVVKNGIWPYAFGLYNEYNWTSQSFGAPVLGITTPSTSTSPPNATVGRPYSFQFSAGGVAGPYSWSLATGSLPAGLTLSSSGLISGTPSKVSKLSAFTLKVDSGTKSA
ncbi:MAG: Ig domain-containing protein, partial [Acidimicrobiales bacterium]